MSIESLHTLKVAFATKSPLEPTEATFRDLTEKEIHEVVKSYKEAGVKATGYEVYPVKGSYHVYRAGNPYSIASYEFKHDALAAVINADLRGGSHLMTWEAEK